MAGSQESFNKKNREKKRLKKRLDKQQKLAERKANSPGGGLENMIAYVDEYGNITDTPPDPSKRTKIDAESIELGVPKREKDDTPSVLKGRVDFFDTSKGFGFIKDLDNQERYFVHVKNLMEEIREGDIVTFEIEHTPKGLNAVGVKKA